MRSPSGIPKNKPKTIQKMPPSDPQTSSYRCRGVEKSTKSEGLKTVAKKSPNMSQKALKFKRRPEALEKLSGDALRTKKTKTQNCV